VQDRTGIYVSVLVNDVLTLHFVVDTGATEVNIPADVALTLLRTNTITESDFLPGAMYRLADGSVIPSLRLNLRSMRLGTLTVYNVSASIGGPYSSPLIGLNVLRQFGSYEIDHQRGVLIIK